MKKQKYTPVTENISFTANGDTFDAKFIVRQLMRKAEERGIKCHYHLVDFKSTFDTISKKAFRMMKRSFGTNKKIVSIVKKIYDKASYAIVVDGFFLTERFSVCVGVR